MSLIDFASRFPSLGQTASTSAGLGLATGGTSILPQLAFQGGGALLEAIGGLFGGDGGAGRRLRTAEGTAAGLVNTKFDPANIARQRASFEQGIQSPLIKRLGRQAAGRVGLDSGVAQGHILGGAQQAGAQFESQAIGAELDRVLRQILAGANLQGSLARG